jgi:5-formyltetrahydrofolate cyclo-ligase
MAKSPDTKESIRSYVWDRMQEQGAARFPLPPHGRIPNFDGAVAAARKLAESEHWAEARVIKINPDSPQQPVRQTALNDGKILYMAVPRLREKKCFIELNPGKLKVGYREATTIRGALKRGKPVAPDDMKEVSLVVAGSVAVNYKGERVGKGGGYSDLEYALGREFGILNDNTPVVTTVHELQVVEFDIPKTRHDIVLDLIATPEYQKLTESTESQPRGIFWELLSDEQINAIPILAEMRSKHFGV